MNGIVNKFLLAGDKFMPGMHLRLPKCTYSSLWTIYKNQEKIIKV